MSHKRKLDEPNMSDTTLLMTVEDLINMAMGPREQNTVNFKLIQTVLHILARQMRMLEQRVEIRITDDRDQRKDIFPKQRIDDIEEVRKSRSPEKRSIDEAIKKTEKAALKEKEKAKQAASKDRAKADRAVSKEREKEEKAAAKEKAREERAASTDRRKAGRAESKDREKGETAVVKAKDDKDAAKEDRATSKDRKKAAKEKEDRSSSAERDKKGKAAEKDEKKEGEKEKADKASAKDKAKAEKEETDKGRSKSPKYKKGKTASDTSIKVSETEGLKGKVLVVEKGPTVRAPEGRRESIEVVTRSQFDIVQEMVKELKQRAGPLPAPALPDNKKLMADLAKGSASLTDTMEAMQVTARVRAAEKAIGRMGEMLTALAAAGALPEDFAVEDLMFEPPEMPGVAGAGAADADTEAKRGAGLSRKSVAIDPLAIPSQSDQKARPSTVTVGRPSTTSRPSMSGASTIGMPGVTHSEMESAIRGLREDLNMTVQNKTSKATSVAEAALMSAKTISEKMEIALALDNKISTIHSLVSDYKEQLSGFDSGLTTQMASFGDQMTQMKENLAAGLKLLEQVNNNAETAAVLELTERYDGLVTELDHTMHTHQDLTAFQNQLGNELRSLVECVEMLREQKADTDEVLDGLRDKADNSRLSGLLTAVEFNMARLDLEKRLDVCHDKFRRQEAAWMTALKDLAGITESKAEIMQLLAVREATEMMLQELQDKQNRLALILGEPKAAVLTRELARGAACAACRAPAIMEALDAGSGAPPPLPALRPRRPADEPCAPEWRLPVPPDARDHTCQRWVGGSHTLLSGAVTREHAPPFQIHGAPTKRYTDVGSDGRLYMLEAELQPCIECNKFSDTSPEETAPARAPSMDGAGDQGPPPETTETA